MRTLVIGITGHRDKLADPAELRAELAQAAQVVHGGAAGFDTQAAKTAHEMGIETVAIVPNYKVFGRGAPLVRNKEIVDSCDYLVACYDGRTHGGTYYTIEYAKQKGKRVVILDPRVSTWIVGLVTDAGEFLEDSAEAWETEVEDGPEICFTGDDFVDIRVQADDRQQAIAKAIEKWKAYLED